MSDEPINPRYAAYARAHGRTVERQLAQDRIDWPGGSMVGFTQWNDRELKLFAKDHPSAFYWVGPLGRFDSPHPPRLHDHDAYDAWLKAKYP